MAAPALNETILVVYASCYTLFSKIHINIFGIFGSQHLIATRIYNTCMGFWTHRQHKFIMMESLASQWGWRVYWIQRDKITSTLFWPLINVSFYFTAVCLLCFPLFYFTVLSIIHFELLVLLFYFLFHASYLPISCLNLKMLNPESSHKPACNLVL